MTNESKGYGFAPAFSIKWYQKLSKRFLESLQNLLNKGAYYDITRCSTC